jgi:hypothetical protein
MRAKLSVPISRLYNMEWCPRRRVAQVFVAESLPAVALKLPGNSLFEFCHPADVGIARDPKDDFTLFNKYSLSCN